MMKLREVADFLRISERTIHRMIREEKLPAFRVGRSWRFRKEMIEKYLANHEK